MTKVQKSWKIESIKGWINMLTRYPAGQTKLAKYNGDELEALTGKQLQMILNYIASAYHAGCNDTREHLKSLAFETRVVSVALCERCNSEVTEVCADCEVNVCKPCHGLKHAKSA